MNNVTTDKTIKSAGFTLLELSIVLVIIGLIVGGVLVGQDLIKAAEIRATVGQYEKYNTAINTFRTKYDGIPGDLASDKVLSFGLSPAAGDMASPGAPGLGDGNGLIQDSAGLGASAGIGEPLLFWQQLTAASLIDGNYSTAITTAAAPAAATTGGTIGQYVPPAKLGKGNYFVAGSASGINYYLLTGFGTVPLTTAGVYTFAPTLTPIDAYNIDVKVDDGLPNTGSTQARGTLTTDALFDTLATTNKAPGHATGAIVAGDCVIGTAATDTAASYSRGPIAGTAPGCILRMRFN